MITYVSCKEAPAPNVNTWNAKPTPILSTGTPPPIKPIGWSTETGKGVFPTANPLEIIKMGELPPSLDAIEQLSKLISYRFGRD